MAKVFRDRDDVKWAHPELTACYDMMCQSIGYENMLNTDIPIAERKAMSDAIKAEFAKMAPPFTPGKTVQVECPGCIEEPDAPPVKMWIAQPKEAKYKKNSPCVLVIPGGGLVTCFVESCGIEVLADRLGVPVAVCQYRCLPDGIQYPAPLNDCEAAYMYLVDHAKELNISPRRIVIHGNSSGGHLTLCLTHRLKRRGITPRGCMVWVPIVDDRPLPDYRSAAIDSKFWGGTDAANSATLYLGKLNNSVDVPVEAFPGRATVDDCVGICPTIIHGMTNDTGLDQQMAYFSKLTAAGVYTEFHSWGGSQHCSLTMAAYTVDLANPDAEYAELFRATCEKNYKDLFENDFTRPWTVEEYNA